MSSRKTITVVTKKKNNKKRRQPRRKPRNAPPTSAIQMAHCTRLYAKALLNPFNVQGLPCIPDNVVLPSYKFCSKARGVFSTGANGFGFVTIDPFQMAINNGFFKNVVGTYPYLGGAIYYTDKTYLPEHHSICESDGAGGFILVDGVVVANSNSPFTWQDWDVNAPYTSIRQFRLVGCGLRIKYIGSNLYNAGRLAIWRNQGNSAIVPQNNYTLADFAQDNYTSFSIVSRSDKFVYYVPDNPDQLAYNSAPDYLPNEHPIPDTTRGHHCMGIAIDGGSVLPNQQSWEFEAVAYFEAVGHGFTLTKSEGDPVGHDIIMSSMPNHAPTTTPQAVESSVVAQFAKGFSETTREVAYSVGRNALGYAANAAINYYSSAKPLLLTMGYP